MGDKKGSGYAASFIQETDKVVEEIAIIHLTETDTEFVFMMPSLVAASDVREISIIDDKNAKYDALVASRSNPDAFESKAMQSINNPTKNQNEMTAANALRDFGSQATSYDIVDETSSVAVSNTDTDPTISEGVNTDITELDDAAGVTPYVKKYVCDTLSVALASQGSL